MRGDNDELYFRDYLQTNTAIAKEYERLKLDLWKQYEHDRNMYTSHKGDFVEQYTQKGKLLLQADTTISNKKALLNINPK